MVVENGYSTNINNTSNENSSYPSSIMDSLQNIVRGLEAQLAQHDEIVKAKDQEIARLENENKQLRAATAPHFYHQNQQRFQSFDRYDFRQKAPEFKQEVTRAVEKALQNFLGEQNPNSQSPSRPQGSWNTQPIIQVTQSPLTTQPPTPDRSIDDNSTNVPSLNNLISNDVTINQSAFQQVQDHRSITSVDLVEDSKEESREQSTYNNNHINNDSELKQNSQQSSSTSSLNGITHNRRYSPNNNGNSNNNNNNNINKRRAYTQYTAFVSWQGPTAPPLKSFFPQEDVKEIRQSPNKSFAHIDFTSNEALERALNRNNTPLNTHGIPGSLRVERGKPRSNTAGNENVQRPPYQNQNQNKYPQKKDRNGFNSTPSNNHHPHFGVGINGYPNHNGHNSDSYALQEDKTLPWQQFSLNGGEVPASQPSNQQDHNKNPEDC